jgi:hypothetical protein
MDRQRKRRRFLRITIATIAIALLYVLSSGPTQSLAMTVGRTTYDDDGLGNVGVCFDFDYAPWYQTVYAPLIWVSQQSCGDALIWYWQWFPIDLK